MTIVAEASGTIRLARITALVNLRAGSAGPDAIAALESRCTALGVKVDARAVEQDWPEAVRNAAASAPDAIAILGGDGTARTRAST